jgi:hypothetical protein
MISDLGSHRLPPALMDAVSPAAAATITARNRAGRRGVGGQQSSARHRREQREVKQGLREPVKYTMTVEEALRAAGL